MIEIITLPPPATVEENAIGSPIPKEEEPKSQSVAFKPMGSVTSQALSFNPKTMDVMAKGEAKHKQANDGTNKGRYSSTLRYV